jgi:hypothetical protein
MKDTTREALDDKLFIIVYGDKRTEVIPKLIQLIDAEKAKERKAVLEEVLLKFEDSIKLSKKERFWTPDYAGLVLSMLEDAEKALKKV